MATKSAKGSSKHGGGDPNLDLNYAETWRPRFLATLRNSLNVRAACEQAGIDRRTAYKHKKYDDEFQKQWEDAIDDAADLLEGLAFQRAMTESDTLMIFLLKAHRPQRFAELRKHQVSGPGGGPVEVISTDERNAKIQSIISGAVNDDGGDG